MVLYQFLVVAAVYGVGLSVAGRVHRQVISHAAADEGFLHSGQRIDGVVDVEQARMVGVEVFAWLGMKARGAEAFGADVEVLAVHAVHVGARAAKVGDVAFEVVHGGHLTSFA